MISKKKDLTKKGKELKRKGNCEIIKTYLDSNLLYLYRRHESVSDNAHAQEHIDERYKVNNSPGHFVPNRGVLGIPHRQYHS